jgi:hypothetical protein
MGSQLMPVVHSQESSPIEFAPNSTAKPSLDTLDAMKQENSYIQQPLVNPETGETEIMEIDPDSDGLELLGGTKPNRPQSVTTKEEEASQKQGPKGGALLSKDATDFTTYCQRRFVELLKESPDLFANKEQVSKLLAEEWKAIQYHQR